MLQISRTLPRLPRGLRLALFGLLVALLLACTVTLLPGLSARAFAATVTCFDQPQPDAAHCDKQDPVAQHCANGAVRTVEVPILDATLHQVGRLQRRESLPCHTWWARIYDDRPHPGPKLFLSLGLRDYPLPYQGYAYCDMTFDLTMAHPPALIGSLSTPDGKPDPHLTASI